MTFVGNSFIELNVKRASVDTPLSGPSTSSGSGRYYRRLSQVMRLVVTSAEAFCGWCSKVCRGFEKVSSVVGRVPVTGK